jgi:hypothetical protein
MTIAAIIEQLETEWNAGGFFDRVRDGNYDASRAQGVLAVLRAIKIGNEEMVPKRLVSLLWYLPSFLAWQTERVAEKGGDRDAYKRFMTEVDNTLQEVLGVP